MNEIFSVNYFGLSQTGYVTQETEIFCTQYESSDFILWLNKISCHFLGPYSVSGTFLDTLDTAIILIILVAPENNHPVFTDEETESGGIQTYGAGHFCWRYKFSLIVKLMLSVLMVEVQRRENFFLPLLESKAAAGTSVQCSHWEVFLLTPFNSLILGH